MGELRPSTHLCNRAGHADRGYLRSAGPQPPNRACHRHRRQLRMVRGALRQTRVNTGQAERASELLLSPPCLSCARCPRQNHPLSKCLPCSFEKLGGVAVKQIFRSEAVFSASAQPERHPCAKPYVGHRKMRLASLSARRRAQSCAGKRQFRSSTNPAPALPGIGLPPLRISNSETLLNPLTGAQLCQSPQGTDTA